MLRWVANFLNYQCFVLFYSALTLLTSWRLIFSFVLLSLTIFFYKQTSSLWSVYLSVETERQLFTEFLPPSWKTWKSDVE